MGIWREERGELDAMAKEGLGSGFGCRFLWG